MTRQLLEYHKSHHFMLSQWDRSIDDQLLYKILPFISEAKENKKLAIITPSFLSLKGIEVPKKNCLVIVLKQKLLKTAFWCDHPNYLFLKEKEATFQILY
jgi:hypothetical protein